MAQAPGPGTPATSLTVTDGTPASVIEYRRASNEEITHVVLAQMVFNNTALFR